MKIETVAQAYLELLSLRGVDYFFANAGTDFASIVDAFAYRQEQGKHSPQPLTIPHEIPLIAMAHGYYLITGKPQVAMVHVGVGTANALGGIINAHRSRIPILFSAGRTPITEDGNPVFRYPFIHWGQESFDQAGMLREYVKWDYELKTPSQLESVVERAFAISLSEPQGPVYLVLPQEVMISPQSEASFSMQSCYDQPTFYPDFHKIKEASNLLSKAKYPLIITSSLGRSHKAVQSLIELADTGVIGVISFNPEYMNFPTDHPYHLGFVPDPHLSKADVILVVDCDVPWYPKMTKPRDSAIIIQAGIDPFFSCYPFRSFPSHLTLQGSTEIILSDIAHSITEHPERNENTFKVRETKLKKTHDDMIQKWHETPLYDPHKPLSFELISYHVNQILRDDIVVVNEYSFIPTECKHPGSYFSTSHAGYLGWGVGAALGIKLALPDKTVVATVGDGCYMFSVPSACHYVSAAHKLPILIIVYNNQGWNAVKISTRALYPDGWAVKTNNFPLTDLKPVSNYEKICEAYGGYGERVTSSDQLQPALERALNVVKNEKRQALLNVICQ